MMKPPKTQVPSLASRGGIQDLDPGAGGSGSLKGKIPGLLVADRVFGVRTRGCSDQGSWLIHLHLTGRVSVVSAVQPSIQALSGHDVYLRLRHAHPTAMLGGVVPLSMTVSS